MIPPGGAWRSRGSRPGVRGYTWHFKVTAGCAGLVCPGCFFSLHRFYGCEPTFRESFLIKMTLEGIKSTKGSGGVIKMPLTPEQLIAMFRHVRKSDDVQMAMWAALIFCFRSLLRKSNVLPRDDSMPEGLHLVRRRDVVFTECGLLVTVYSTKTFKYRDRVLLVPIVRVAGSPLCAVSLLTDHFARIPGNSDDLLFLRQVTPRLYRPIRYSEVLFFLKDLAQRLGLDRDCVGLHSMRRSGALFLRSVGVDLTDIQSMGDWRSMAALVYLVSPLDRKVQVDTLAAAELSKLG